jgi:hypothetical protein
MHHRRIACRAAATMAIALIPAAPAAAQSQSNRGTGNRTVAAAAASSSSSAGICSEVCSGHGYGTAPAATNRPGASIGARRAVASPLASARSGSVGSTSGGICSEVCSGHGYGTAPMAANRPGVGVDNASADSLPSPLRSAHGTAGSGWAWTAVGGGLLGLVLLGAGGRTLIMRRASVTSIGDASTSK